jgi:hypothetical protein
VAKSGPGEASDGLNKQRRNRFLQRVGMCPSMRIRSLWCGLNGPMVVFPSITVFLVIMERYSNGWGASNGHIASPWRIHILRGSVVPVRFRACNPAFCKVFSRTFYSFSNLAFFLLSFLSFFHVI